MALPVDIVTVTITGTYLTMAGAPPTSGSVTFSTSLVVTDAAYKVMLVPTTITATISPSTGSFSVLLPSSNTPVLSPAYTWQVTEKLNNEPDRTYSVIVPYNLGSTIDLSTLAPVAASTATGTYVLSTQVGIAGGVAGPLASDKTIPPAQILYAAGGAAQTDSNNYVVDASLAPGIPALVQYPIGGPWPLRSTKTAVATRTVFWKGPVDPTFAAGYALPGVDVWLQET